MKLFRTLAFRVITMLAAVSGASFATAVATAYEGAPPNETADARFESMLRAIDVVPPNAAALVSAFPDAHTRLLAAAADEGRDDWTRQRAVSLLSFFPVDATRERLVAVAAASKPGPRAMALYTLGRTFGPLAPSLPDPALAALRAGLDAADTDVRDRAVRALRWVKDARAEALLDTAAARPDLRRLADVTRSRRARLLGAER